MLLLRPGSTNPLTFSHITLVVLNAIVHQRMFIIFQFLKGYPPLWTPRVDGVFLQDNPQKLIEAGKVANVPFVTGMHFLPSSYLW